MDLKAISMDLTWVTQLRLQNFFNLIPSKQKSNLGGSLYYARIFTKDIFWYRHPPRE